MTFPRKTPMQSFRSRIQLKRGGGRMGVSTSTIRLDSIVLSADAMMGFTYDWGCTSVAEIREQLNEMVEIVVAEAEEIGAGY